MNCMTGKGASKGPRFGEEERVAALERYRILGSPSEWGFDHLAFLAPRLCETSMAAIVFHGREGTRVKASVGMGGVDIESARGCMESRLRRSSSAADRIKGALGSVGARRAHALAQDLVAMGAKEHLGPVRRRTEALEREVAIAEAQATDHCRPGPEA
jgi:hypothetical protein